MHPQLTQPLGVVVVELVVLLVLVKLVVVLVLVKL
jgi:hypothetical protein